LINFQEILRGISGFVCQYLIDGRKVNFSQNRKDQMKKTKGIHFSAI